MGVSSETLGGSKAAVQRPNTSDAASIAVRANAFGGNLFVGNNRIRLGCLRG